MTLDISICYIFGGQVILLYYNHMSGNYIKNVTEPF